MNCCVVPSTNEGAAGVTAIETSVGGGAVTVRLADPETPPEVALIVVVPAASVAAIPEVFTVAMFCAEDDQLTVVSA